MIAYDESWILEDYLPALINGDHSGLEDQDEEYLSAWIRETKERIAEQEGKEIDRIGLIFSPLAEEGSFSRDDISGLYGNCVQTEIFYYILPLRAGKEEKDSINPANSIKR